MYFEGVISKERDDELYLLLGKRFSGWSSMKLNFII
jgi:hypothetical protein